MLPDVSPQPKTQRIVVVGDGETADLACEYFTHDSACEVVAFSVEASYLTRGRLFDLPVVPFEELETLYPPSEYALFVAISYTKLNRVRARLYGLAKSRGYRFVSYVSSRAFVWRNVKIGENCFILENNVLQYSVTIGNNVVLWSGNHIGHQTIVRDHCFVSSHVVISGYCEVGEYCFLGVNSCVANNVKIASNCLIGMGAVINRDTEEGRVYRGSRAEASGADSFTAFGLTPPDR